MLSTKSNVQKDLLFAIAHIHSVKKSRLGTYLLVMREFPAIVFSTRLPVCCSINKVKLEGILED